MSTPTKRSSNKTRRNHGKKAAVAEQRDQERVQGRAASDARSTHAADAFHAHVRRLQIHKRAREGVNAAPPLGASSLQSLHSHLWGLISDSSEALKALHKACREAGARADTYDGLPLPLLQEFMTAQTEVMRAHASVSSPITRINKLWLDHELDADGSEVTIKSDDYHAAMETYAAEVLKAVLEKLGPEQYAEIATAAQARMAELQKEGGDTPGAVH